MKIKLYQGVNEDTNKEDLVYREFEIIGRMIHYLQLPEYNINPEYDVSGFYERRFFKYEYDNSYKWEFGSLKLNYKLTIYNLYEGEGEYITGDIGYVHLNIINRIQLGWIFQQNWLQKPENIKWLISIPISILTAYITTKIAKQ